MLIIQRIWQTLQRLFSALQQAVRSLAQAVIRIFSPSDDQYPEIGVQPFEGETADKDNHGHSW
jgi:hypothetical protein